MNLISMSRYQSHTNGQETLRLGVGVALIDERSRLLLELRSDVQLWGITGGSLDIGETPEECGCREILEETGLTISPCELTLFGVYGDRTDFRVLQYPDARVQLVDIIYTATIDSTCALRMSSESIELQFFDASSIPLCIVPPAIRPINDLVCKGIVR